LEKKAVAKVRSIYLEDSDKAISYAVRNLPDDVCDFTLDNLSKERRIKNWEASLNPVQKWLNKTFPSQFDGTLLTHSPKQIDEIRAREKAKDKAYWDSFDGGSVASALPD
jgi:hypothetical protein